MVDIDPRPAVLIIESDPATSDLYARELGHHFTVLACENVAEALQVLEQRPFDAIVLEPVGLGALGWDLLRTARNHLLNCRTPFVICSTLDDRKIGMDRGAAVYLVKPVLPAMLISVLQRLVEVSQPTEAEWTDCQVYRLSASCT
jgi:DNA-binding response OmpR family regulator